MWTSRIIFFSINCAMKERQWQIKISGHRERLRERFLAKGLDGFTDAEIVELLLALGTPRQDCKERAREAVRRFGSLAGVLEAPVEELMKVPGIGPRNSIALKLVHEVARAFLRSKVVGRDCARAMPDLLDYLRHRSFLEPREVLAGVFMGRGREILDVQELAQGEGGRLPFFPRQVVKKALELDAYRVVLAHNHPGGSLRPSREDLEVTERLARACAALDILLEDHLIVTREAVFSFKANGLMDRMARP